MKKVDEYLFKMKWWKVAEIVRNKKKIIIIIAVEVM